MLQEKYGITFDVQPDNKNEGNEIAESNEDIIIADKDQINEDKELEEDINEDQQISKGNNSKEKSNFIKEKNEINQIEEERFKYLNPEKEDEEEEEEEKENKKGKEKEKEEDSNKNEEISNLSNENENDNIEYDPIPIIKKSDSLQDIKHRRNLFDDEDNEDEDDNY